MKNNDSNFSTNFNTNKKIMVKHPNFNKPFNLNVNKQTFSNNEYNSNYNNNYNPNSGGNLNYQEQMNKIYEERLKIQNRIQKLDDEEKKNSSNKNNNNLELRKAQIAYCKDPFKYMDYLLEEHFKNNYNNNKNDEEIKKKIQEDYDKFQKGLIEDFTIFKNRQKVYLEKLQDQFYVINRRKNNINILDENAELVSEPLYQGENIKNIFSQLPQNKYNLIINSAGDTKNELINNVDSKYYKNKLCQGVIHCMNGNENFAPPSKKFLEINNFKMDRDTYIEGKNEFNIKRYKEKIEKDCEEKIINNEEKTVNLQNKMFDIKYNNYLNEINKYENKNEEYFKIISDIKDKMTKDKLFDKLTQKQLNILKKSKEEIKEILMQKNNNYGIFGFDLNNNDNNNEKNQILKEQYFKEMNETNTKFNKDIKLIDDEIEKMKQKYNNKKKGLSKDKINFSTNNNYQKRNKSSFIGNRKYYNDNPYHYQYNYNGASIPIKKNLKIIS